MHAYLIVTPNKEEGLANAISLAKKIGENFYEFSLTKIEEVRNLNLFVKLSFEKPTTIIIKDIEKATEEALNAFLKNLEEPQKNLTYILLARSEEKLIPTIVSRCQVIRVRGKEKADTNQKEIQDFLEMSTGEKFAYLEKIKDRKEAIDFIEKIILFWHKFLVTGENDSKTISEYLKIAEKTHKNLTANGNVSLQLTNFVVNLGLINNKN